jgi:hypothetical protein
MTSRNIVSTRSSCTNLSAVRNLMMRARSHIASSSTDPPHIRKPTFSLSKNVADRRRSSELCEALSLRHATIRHRDCRPVCVARGRLTFSERNDGGGIPKNSPRMGQMVVGAQCWKVVPRLAAGGHSVGSHQVISRLRADDPSVCQRVTTLARVPFWMVNSLMVSGLGLQPVAQPCLTSDGFPESPRPRWRTAPRVRFPRTEEFGSNAVEERARAKFSGELSTAVHTRLLDIGWTRRSCLYLSS